MTLLLNFLGEIRMTLKELREQNKKTVAEVATALGVAQSTYYGYEKGTRSINIAQVLTLAIIFQAECEDVILAQLESVAKSKI